MNGYIEALRKYAVFSGRSRRREYWVFVLGNLLVSAVLTWLDTALGTQTFPVGSFGLPEGTTAPGAGALPEEALNIGLLSLFYSLAVFIPGLAVTVRRLHDIGRSGWWLLIGIVPLVGVFVIFVFTLLDSQPGENKYGPNPKETGPAV